MIKNTLKTENLINTFLIYIEKRKCKNIHFALDIEKIKQYNFSNKTKRGDKMDFYLSYKMDIVFWLAILTC